MDVLNRLRLRQDQKVVIALLMAGAADKALTTKMILVVTQPLDLRTHGTVDHENALTGGFFESFQNFCAITASTFGTEQFIEQGRHS
ncbi:hypothetical protein D3C87_1577860 [compost metagenome]